jgi:hypothetical protein
LVARKENRAWRVLKSLEVGKKEFLPPIGPVKAKIIANIVRKHKPKKFGNWNSERIFCDIDG